MATRDNILSVVLATHANRFPWDEARDACGLVRLRVRE
jgi:hypothetical protein